MPNVCTAGTLMYAGTADHYFVLFNMMMMMMMMMGMQIRPIVQPKSRM